MLPRINIFRTARQAIPPITTQVCRISKTAASQDIRRNVPGLSRNSLLESIDPDQPSSNRRDALGVTGVFEAFANNKSRDGMGPPSGERRAVDVVGEMSTRTLADGYMRQMPRRWREGDVYSPHDLTPAEMRKWKRVTTVKKDVVDMLGLRPLDMYRNFSFISEYMTPHGRIMRSEQTGLRPVNQRKVAKAIRRAIGLGLHPSVYRHPELLATQSTTSRAQHTSESRSTQLFKV